MFPLLYGPIHAKMPTACDTALIAPLLTQSMMFSVIISVTFFISILPIMPAQSFAPFESYQI